MGYCRKCGSTGVVHVPVDSDGVGRTYVCGCPAGREYWYEQAEEGEQWLKQTAKEARERR